MLTRVYGEHLVKVLSTDTDLAKVLSTSTGSVLLSVSMGELDIALSDR